MKCAGCQRQFEVGDRYIEMAASEVVGGDGWFDDLIADILGCGNGDKVVYCEDCTVDGGRFVSSTYYGDGDAPEFGETQEPPR